MANDVLRQRTKEFALRVIRMVEKLPNTKSSYVIGQQVLRSATSVGANYRAVCVAKSDRDFINKLKIVEEEADETVFWLELIEESGIVSKERLIALRKEANEILAMVVASIKTARKNQSIKV
jgi:four helix bundle protein